MHLGLVRRASLSGVNDQAVAVPTFEALALQPLTRTVCWMVIYGDGRSIGFTRAHINL